MCLDPAYHLVDGSGPQLEREEDQSSSALARVLSEHPRASGKSEAAAGYLALRADSTIVPLPPGITYAAINAEAYWRRPIVIQSGSPTALTGTMVGLFLWEGGLDENSAPLTTQGDDPLNGTRAAALLRAGAQDERCQNEIAAVERFDSLCTGRRVLETGPCTGDAVVDELFQIEIPFTFGVPFQLFAFARLETDVVNLDESVADDWFGGARAKFDGTGRWMGILEVRDFLGTPLDDYTVTDLATGDVDWTQPVPAPEPGAATQGCVALAFLAWITCRRRCCCRAARVILLCTLVAEPARAEVTWVPYDDGPDFIADAYAGTFETGALCPDPEADGCVDNGEDHASDVLNAGLPSFGTRAAEVSTSAAGTGSSAQAGARYLVTWEELGPNSHVGHVELEVFGETNVLDPPPESTRRAGTFAEARAYFCFLVEDQPVEVRIFGTWVGVLTDYNDFTAADGPQIQNPGGWTGPQLPGAFDSGSLAVLPGTGIKCITADLFADEYLFADDELSSPPQTDAATLSFDFTILPVPEPGAGAAFAVALAALRLLRRPKRLRRTLVAAFGLATSLLAASPAHALVRLSTQYPPSAYVVSQFDLKDSSSPECTEQICYEALRDLATFALLDVPASTVSFEEALAASEAELDQSYTVQFTFEDTPLGPTLTGGSASITSASRGIAAASPVPDLNGATMIGIVGLNWGIEVTAPVYLYVFGSATLIGGPLADRGAEPLLCPPVFGGLCGPHPTPMVMVSVPGATFDFALPQDSESGSFDSGELLLAPGLYGFLAIAGTVNAVPIVADAPETHLVQEDLDVEFVFVPVPEPGALVQALVALVGLLGTSSARRRR